MKNETTANTSVSLVENTTIDPRIKPAILLPHTDSRLDTALQKFHPLSDKSIPFRDLANLESKKRKHSSTD